MNENQGQITAALNLARLEARLDAQDKTLTHVEATLAEIQAELRAVRAAADRWKGGFLVVIALGGFVSWLLSIGTNLGLGKVVGK